MIIITGSSSGIGHKVASLLIEDAEIDEEIILTSRRDPCLDSSTWIKCDFSSYSDIENLIRSIKGRKEPISFLLHCAGSLATSSIDRLSYESFQNAFHVNAIAPALITSALTRQLAKGGATVVAISSIASEIHIPGEAVYSASKTALLNLFDSFSASLSRLGITYLTVLPSLISSPMTQDLAPERLERVRSRQSTKRDPTVEDIANYLVSLRKSCSFVTGSKIYFGGIRR
jgi:NAD(P)-dependent dehydrogenase (short-subunit alcohol dehydrogenase family)